MAESIKVDDSRLVVALGKFQGSLAQNEELMRQIGQSELVSIRRNFRDEGVPAGSWPRLAPSTEKRYGSGHRLLIRSGRLQNSIHADAEPNRVTIGTNLRYARVQQLGSKDYGFGARTLAQSAATIGIAGYHYHRVAPELGTGHLPHAGRRRIQGPRNASVVNVRKHARHQNIPPRPYIVFRPEDAPRIRGIVERYIAQAKKSAGLGGAR